MAVSRPRTTPNPPPLHPVNTGSWLNTIEDIPGIGQIVSLFDPGGSKGTVGGLSNQASGAIDKATGIPNIPSTVQTVAGDVESLTSGAVSDLGSFLKFIAWLFNPINLLRVVEFATGLFLFTLGFAATIQGIRESHGRFYGYGGVFRRSFVGRRLNLHRMTDVERVRYGGGRQGGSQRAGRGEYQRSEQRPRRRRERDRRRNSQGYRGKQRGN